MSDTTTAPPPDSALGRLGAVVREDGEVLLRFERHYDAPAADVWSALTDPDRTARWLGRWTGDPASGQVLLTMADEEGTPTEPVTVDRCEPPTRLDVTMTTGDGPWPLTVLVTEEAGRTRLLFTHRLAEPFDASAVGPGWHYYLDRLGAVVAGVPVPDDFTVYHPRLAAAYPVPPA
ncbi:SRPBCC family protein [Microlunatus lacustris]